MFMDIDELMSKFKELGIVKGTLEKRCGFYSGKLTELAGGRLALKEETIEEIATGLEEMAEEIALLAEEVRKMDERSVGKYCVYEFTFPNGKKYYGMTANINSRWQNGRGYKTQLVGKAIEEFGWENVDKRIIAENLAKANAALIERTLIKATGSDMPGFGYNGF